MMAVDFHYGGLPPAMVRALGGTGVQQQAVEEERGGMQLPQIPQGMQMELPHFQGGPVMPQIPQNQGVRSLESLQQFMPQAGSAQSPQYMQTAQGVTPFQQANPYVSNMLGSNNGMPNMDAYMQSRQQFNNQNLAIIDAQKARANQMNMGAQDVGSGDSADVKVSKGLGSLSAKYESNGNPATIANNKNDIGGASYGSYQLSTNSGHAQKFASSYGGALKGKKPGTASFDAAWKAEAKKNPKAFQSAQHKYIENNHYKPAASNIKKKTGFDVSKYPKAVQDAVWSIGVQHGAGGAASIFKNAGVKNGMGAAQVLRKVYAERSKVHIYFKSTKSDKMKANIKDRFNRELQDALKML